jgi:CRP-like cAMP-binding protein
LSSQNPAACDETDPNAKISGAIMTDYNSTRSGDVATPETTNLKWQSHAGHLIQQHDRWSTSSRTSDSSRNGLLAALEPSDFALLHAHLRQLSLTAGATLQEQEAPVEQIYFPLNGLISLVAVMEAGEVVETATVGRWGAVGAFAGLGPWHAFTRAVVQIPGTAMVISASHFQAAVSQSERIRDLILRYKEGLLAQVQQTAACNALHQVEARLVRWLLQAIDCVDDPKLPLTHDHLAEMLAVRRTTVTVIAGKLQEAGLIRYHRGRIEVVDRIKLEEAACECYGTIRRRTDAVFCTPQTAVI